MKIKLTYSRLQFLVFLTIISLVYFAIGNISLYFVSLGYFWDFSTGIDSSLPIYPNFIYFYILYYPIYVSPAFVNINNTQRKDIMQKMLLLSIISGVIYLAFPAVPLNHDISMLKPSFSLTLLLWIYSIDIPTNLFPSLHVAHSVVITIAYWKIKQINLSIKYSFIFASIGLSISTFLVEQHYFLDFIGGTLLALLVTLLHNRKQAYSPT